MKKTIVILCLLLILLLTACQTDCLQEFELLEEQVIDLGIYNIADWSYVTEHYYDFASDTSLACSSFFRQLDNGNYLTARNMDLVLNNNPVFIYRTDNAKYKTINIAYSGFTDYSYEEMLENGIDKDYLKIIPGFTTDSFNEKGLYISINMREIEVDDTGNVRWAVKSTNPTADTKLLNFAFALYFSERCETVDDVLDELKSVDLISKKSSAGWNFGIAIMDSSGRHGVLELMDNKAIWNEGQSVNTNTYIDEEYRSKAEYLTGLGREEYLKENLERVHSFDDALSLITDVNSGSMYLNPDDCKFDMRNDFLDTSIGWTTAFVMDEANQKEVWDSIAEYAAELNGMTGQERRECGDYWMSVYTVIANANSRKLFVRFFEDDTKTIELSF